MSVTATTKLQFLWRDARISTEFRSGVSLHSHTMYSEETLEIVPRYIAGAPYLGAAIRRETARYNRRTGAQFDFGRCYWTPPLTARQAFRVEEKQIQRRFQLPGIISLTDHNDIRAGSLLTVMDRFSHSLISTEWTIPFGPTFFHIGVHNLPKREAVGSMGLLRKYTADPHDEQLGKLLSLLNTYRDVLLVLNHPMLDEKGIGAYNNSHVLGRLIERHGRHFHALELNGLRSWTENKEVMWLARQTGLPLVSGGDRHGREPNAILNLSRGRTLAEFINELRFARTSHVVFMPQYHEPLKLRILQTIVDILRDYPENMEGRRTWGERVYYRSRDSEERVPLSGHWAGRGPALVNTFVSAIKLLEWPGVRSLLRMALDDRSNVWGTKLPMEMGREADYGLA